MRYFRFLISDAHMRQLLMDFGFGGLIQAFEKYEGKKKTGNLIKGLRVGLWAAIALGVLSVVEKCIDIFLVSRNEVLPGSVSTGWKVGEFFEVLFSREFSILLMEEFGGTYIVLIPFAFFFLWVRLSWSDHKMEKRFQALEEQIPDLGDKIETSSEKNRVHE